MSSREKLLLIVLYTQAGKDLNCRICLQKLAQLTTTSTRHLSRLIHRLARAGLIRVARRAGQCNTYSLPANYHIVGDQLRADWSSSATTKKPQRGTNNWRPDPALVQAWQSAFSAKYQPVTPKEQKAMDYMLFANNSGQLSHVKSPVAYLLALVRNGHPTDFPSFFERKKIKEKQSVSKKNEEEKEQKKLDSAWAVYTNFPKSRQKKIKNKFKSQFLATQPRQVVDIFAKKGFRHPIINALYRTYVARHV